MTTGFMMSTLDPEHQRMTKESNNFQEVLKKLGRKEEGEEQKEEEEQLKKPRRKDTPVLHSPPHIPGVSLLKVEKHMIHLDEDDEKDVKN